MTPDLQGVSVGVSRLRFEHTPRGNQAGVVETRLRRETVSPYSIEKLYAGAGPGGVEGAGPGLGSATSWANARVVVLLLLALGWWGTTRGRRR